MILFGTRPEAIKMAPLAHYLVRLNWIKLTTVVTGQHREMLDQVLSIFDICPDIDLNLMVPGQSLSDLTGRALSGISDVLDQAKPDLLLVQGDTTSAFVGALAGFYRNIAIGHIEAGLRSADLFNPFPEEGNRRLISVLSHLHFAPTERARLNLLAEGVDEHRIFVTGNTVVDALEDVVHSAAFASRPSPYVLEPDRRLVLVTLHRRESWGKAMAAMCESLLCVLERFTHVRVLFPVHRNPVVRDAVTVVLGQHPQVNLVEPLDYLDFVRALAACDFVVTDSGGIQEEAPALGKPVLVLRDTTERPEAIEAGTARLVGTNPDNVRRAITLLIEDSDVYRSMAHAANPFGDGHASERIAAAIGKWARSTGRVDEGAFQAVEK
jgi:UDP-N-acetylglucosamine 2-epimerase (non-hydrolysing)